MRIDIGYNLNCVATLPGLAWLFRIKTVEQHFDKRTYLTGRVVVV